MKLYTPELLALAVELAQHPLTEDLIQRGEARSRSCGSTVSVGLATGADGAIERFGMQVAACAVGQAASALFARDAIGRTAGDIERAEHAIDAWLAGGTITDWPGLEAIAPARDHPGRHGAILLPWRAARDALSKPAREG